MGSPRSVGTAVALVAVVAIAVAACGGAHTRSMPMVDSHEKSHNKLPTSATGGPYSVLISQSVFGYPTPLLKTTLRPKPTLLMKSSM